MPFRLSTLLPMLAAAPAPVVLMVEDAAAPWSRPDGGGYANELVRAAFAAAGQPVRLQVVPYARCKAYVMQGAVAGCFSMSAAPGFDGHVQFADQPLFKVTPHLYARPGLSSLPAGPDGIAPGARIGTVHGYEYPPALLAQVARGVRLQEASSEALNLKKLALGRLDYAVLMSDAMKTEAVSFRSAGVTALTLAFGLPPMGSYLGFSPRHPDGERARLAFNEGYRQIIANGTRDKLARKWQLCASDTGSAPECAPYTQHFPQVRDATRLLGKFRGDAEGMIAGTCGPDVIKPVGVDGLSAELAISQAAAFQARSKPIK